MKNPVDFLSDFVFAPLKNAKRYVQNQHIVKKVCGKSSNFLFKHCKDPAIIMIICNFIAIVSSHNAQIRGLKNSKRENADYLIDQERKEKHLDMVLSLVPPILIKRFFTKQFESGHITTKSARETLIDNVAGTIGASRDDLYSVEHIRPLSETVAESTSNFIETIVKKFNKLPDSVVVTLRKFNKFLKTKFPDPRTKNYRPELETITTDFDNMVLKNQISPKTLSRFNLRNNSAYDELNGMHNGWNVIATILFSIAATNIIMPILKNKLSNRAYERQLNEMGETRESMRRKKRFAYHSTPVSTIPQASIFSSISTFSNEKTPVVKDNSLTIPIQRTPNVFSQFEKYSSAQTQSGRLRI